MKLQNFIKGAFKTRLKLLSVVSKKRAGDAAFTIFCTPIGKGSYSLTPILQSAQKINLDVNGNTLKGYRWNKNAGKKILIAHGFRSHTQRFEHLITLLTEKGYEIIAFDAPAHGMSGGKQINAVDYTKLVEVLNKKFGNFNAYIGHSFGGLATALAVSEIPNNENIKLVLFAPASNTVRLAEIFFKEMGIENNRVKEHFFNNVTRLSGKDLTWFSIRRCVKQLKGPVLWIHDETDKVTPVSDALEIKELNQPNMKFVLTKGLGHSKIYRNPEVIKTVMDFLG